MGIHHLVGEFEAYLVCEKQVSRNTTIEYIRDVKQFCDFALRNKVNNINEFTRELTVKFRMELKENNISARSISRKITSLREFFKFLQNRHNFHDITLIAPQFEYKLPEYFPRTQIMSIVDFINQDKTIIGKRNQLLFNMSYATGVRVTELINIKLDNINLDHQLLMVNGKGNKQRYIPFPKSVKKDLKNYISKTRRRFFSNENQKSDFLFFTISKNKPKPFTRQGVWSIFKNIGKKLQLKLYPHKLRHSIATHLLENGANLTAIQKLLGHESVNTTSNYTHLDVKHLRKSYDKFHPRK